MLHGEDRDSRINDLFLITNTELTLQLAGVATFFVAVNWRESITRRISLWENTEGGEGGRWREREGGGGGRERGGGGGREGEVEGEREGGEVERERERGGGNE